MHYRLKVKPETVKQLEEVLGKKNSCNFKDRERLPRYDTGSTLLKRKSW